MSNINFEYNGVKLHKLLPEGFSKYIIHDDEAQIAKYFLHHMSISHEAVDDEWNEYRECMRCGAWKPKEEFSSGVYLSYPGQYECLDCCHGKTKPTIETIIPKDAKIVSVTKDPDDDNSVIVGYRSETKNSGIIFCPFPNAQEEKND